MRMTQFTMEPLWAFSFNNMDVPIQLFNDRSQYILHIYPKEDPQLVQWTTILKKVWNLIFNK